jgi:FKBP-type peptidyl-prolyl cis-trans isomerase SlyD
LKETIMQIAMNTVVSMTYELRDSEGTVLESSADPVSYLHGGYDNIFPRVEEELHGKAIGDSVEITLEPADAFGEYDETLVQMEPIAAFPSKDLKVGMQFEGVPDADEESVEIEDDSEEEPLIYTVTDVADNQVVLDGNHPLAGMALRFWVQVEDIRAATEDEIENRHPKGGESFSFGMPNDDDDGEEEFSGTNVADGNNNPRTLH